MNESEAIGKPGRTWLGLGNPTESTSIDPAAQAQAWEKSCAQFAKAGVHLFFPHVTLTDCWLGADRYDFAELDATVARTLRADPEARMILRLRLKVPPWWHEARPGQGILYADGSNSVPEHHWGGTLYPPSLASQAWWDDSNAVLRAAVDHVQAADWAERVVGYNPALMHGGEWFEEGGMYGRLADYSPLMQAAFRKWLAARYPGESFPEQVVPTPAERMTGDIGHLLDPATAKSRRTADYLLFASDLIAAHAERCCRTIKEASGGKALTGIYYGYTLELTGVREHHGWLQNSGHLALRRIVNSPHVDYVSSMLEYVFKGPGGFSWSFGPLSDSARVHGKFYVGEDEVRTWLDKTDPRVFLYIFPTRNPEETVHAMRRNFACATTHGAHEELADLGGGWYDHPQILDCIAELERLASGRPWDRSPVTQVALFVDEVSPAYQSTPNATDLNKALLMDSLLPSFHLGAPIDIFLLSDLTDGHVPLDQYRFLVFLNAFYLTDEQRRFLKTQAQSGGRTLLWYYAPGFLGPAGAAAEKIHDLTGIKTAFDLAPAVLRVSAQGEVFGTKEVVSPIFYADDPDAEVLGTLQHNGEAGLCVRRFGDWTSIYCAAPCLPPAILRRFAKDAGVHLYVETDDLIHAAKGFLAIHAGTDGEKRIRLPRACDLADPFTHRLDARQTREFALRMKTGETKIWLLKNGHRNGRGRGD